MVLLIFDVMLLHSKERKYCGWREEGRKKGDEKMEREKRNRTFLGYQ